MHSLFYVFWVLFLCLFTVMGNTSTSHGTSPEHKPGHQRRHQQSHGRDTARTEKTDTSEATAGTPVDEAGMLAGTPPGQQQGAGATGHASGRSPGPLRTARSFAAPAAMAIARSLFPRCHPRARAPRTATLDVAARARMSQAPWMAGAGGSQHATLQWSCAAGEEVGGEGNCRSK